MSIKYKIWNKLEVIKTRIGERLTPEEWMLRHPEAESEYPIISAGDVNGDISASLKDMLIRAYQQGFSTELKLSSDTAQQILDEIESWELTKIREPQNAVSFEERIAAALEYQNLMNY